MRYNVVTACSQSELEESVNRSLREGFELHGNLAVLVNKWGVKRFYQPMIKHDKKVVGVSQILAEGEE